MSSLAWRSRSGGRDGREGSGRGGGGRTCMLSAGVSGMSCHLRTPSSNRTDRLKTRSSTGAWLGLELPTCTRIPVMTFSGFGL
eukprot:988435-Prorocentrum_minimum.AAC.2